MDANVYSDYRAENQLLGAIYKNMDLLDNKCMSNITPEDFTGRYSKDAYKIIYNLHNQGYNRIDLGIIETYIYDKPKTWATYSEENEDGIPKGRFYFDKLRETGEEENFSYAYNKVKKMSLLRNLCKQGVDVTRYYNPLTINEDQKQKQEEWLENHELQEIASIITGDIELAVSKTVQSFNESYSADYKANDLVKRLQKSPDFGAPYPIDIFNTFTRGMRLGTVTMFSGASGSGKTRHLVSWAVSKAYGKIYDWNSKKWIVLDSNPEKVIYIGQELSLEELQQIILSFISGVPEHRIVEGRLTKEEEDVIAESIDLMNEYAGNLILEITPDYTIELIEKLIKSHARRGVTHFFFDYINLTLGILQEMSKLSFKNMREDQVLLMLVTRLKELATLHNIFIGTASQLNADAYEGELGINSLRGAKSMADKIDVGIIGSKVRKIDKKIVEELRDIGYTEEIDYYYVFYKIRGSQYMNYKIYGKYDHGTMQFKPVCVLNSAGVPEEVAGIRVYNAWEF